EVGFLMADLSDWLLPDRDEPLEGAEQERLLGALARLHARFWDGPVRSLDWAAQPTDRFGIFHPLRPQEPMPVFDSARRGWPAALARLPRRIGDLLTQPPDRLAAACGALPWTLLHGDCKVANFALLPDGRVAAFDWEALAVGPAPLELGYYLAVN